MDEFVQCPICMDNYDVNVKIPRMLPCQHSLCCKCLEDLYNCGKPMVECPICRQQVDSQLNDIPKNRFIIQYIENLYASSLQKTNVQSDRQYASNNEATTPSQADHWDEKIYLKKIFDEIDHNNDGEIDSNELHEALRQGQPTSEFDPKTVQLLLSKYDRNSDAEISFDEFYQLFGNLNEQYNNFLDIDTDFSGSIDSSELKMALDKKNYNLTMRFFDFLTSELANRTGKQTITFDLYVRVIARIDTLINELRRRQSTDMRPKDVEYFLANGFFQNF